MATERDRRPLCFCCGEFPVEPDRTMCRRCIESGCHPARFCKRTDDD